MTLVLIREGIGCKFCDEGSYPLLIGVAFMPPFS